MSEALCARLMIGSRGEVGEAAGIAAEMLDQPSRLPLLLGFLEDDDAAVVAHAAHALMQVGADRPDLFTPHVDMLTDRLEACRQWEIGEQLPKILCQVKLDAGRAGRLAAILERQVDNRSNIAAASALEALVVLAERGLADSGQVRAVVERATGSPRKAVIARARRLLGRLGQQRDRIA